MVFMSCTKNNFMILRHNISASHINYDFSFINAGLS